MNLFRKLARGVLGGVFLTGLVFSAQAKMIVAGSPDGQPVSAIVVARGALKLQIEAAEELQRTIEKITGEKLPIVTDDVPPPGPSCLAVGGSRLTEQLGVSTKDFPLEGFLIKTVKGNLILAGDDANNTPPLLGVRRGSFFAVCEFLEGVCGVRWLWPGEEEIPRRETLAVPETEIRQAPDFRVRSFDYGYPFFLERELHDPPDFPKPPSFEEWGKHQRLGRTLSGWYGHSWSSHLRGVSFDEHPEYWPLVSPENWVAAEKPKTARRQPYQLCSSNPEVVNLIVHNVLGKREEKNTVTSVSPDDGNASCECADCRARDLGDDFPRVASNRVFGFVNEVARAVRAANPEKRVGIFAYLNYRNAPANVEKIEDNAVLSNTHYCSIFRDAATRDEFRKNAAAFHRLGFRIVGREYWGTHYWMNLPWLHSKLLAENTAWMKDNGFIGLYGESGRDYANMAPTYYLLTKLMWNAHRDPKAILDDFYLHAYGSKAAPVMARYFQTWEESIDRNFHVLQEFAKRYPEDAAIGSFTSTISNWHLIFPEDVQDRCAALLQEALKLAETDRQRERIRFAEVGLKYTRILTGLTRVYRQLLALGIAVDPMGKFKPDDMLTDKSEARLLDTLRQAWRLGEERTAILKQNRSTAALDWGLYRQAMRPEWCLRPWHRVVTAELARRDKAFKNLVANGGFEEGMKGWEVQPLTTARVGVEDRMVHAGAKSLRVDCRPSERAEVFAGGRIAVRPGARYFVSTRARTTFQPLKQVASVRVSWFNAEGKPCEKWSADDSVKFLETTEKWVELNFMYAVATSPPDARFAQVAIEVRPDEGEKEYADWKANKLPVFDMARDYAAARSDYTVWFDDVAFVEMTERP
jgi:hypothetical protein